MARNQAKSTNVNWGICTNTSGKADGTPCSKCQNKEKQAIRASKDFVCEECGETLTKIPTPKPQPPLGLIIGAAVVIIGLAVGAYFLFSGKDKPVVEEPVIETPVVEEPVVEEPVVVEPVVEEPVVEQAIVEEPKPEPKTESKPAKPAQTSNTSNWNGVATYSGPMQGGQPHGIGGKLTFKSNYSLDLKDGKGTKLDINAGETIENTKFENGKLRQGELHRKDGTRKWFNI